jgi:hypothetical protein
VTDTGTYLYAVTRHPAAAVEVAGLDEAPIRLVEHRGLVALVSDVDLADYGEEGLRTNLEDLRWLETVARGHDAVVRAATAGGPLTPFRLATVFFNDESMLARLDESYDALLRALDRVDDRMEWSVKVLVPDVPADEVSPGTDAQSTPGRARSGTDYLMQKRAAQQHRESAADRAAGLADDLHQALSTGVVASRRLSPQDPRLTGHKGTMVLNAAYLVDNATADAFVDTVADLHRSHPTVSIDLHGPWPPYSFATLDDE